jgi:hypothetical protein
MTMTYLLRRYACRVWLDHISRLLVQSTASRVRPVNTSISKALANAYGALQGRISSKLVGTPSLCVIIAHEADTLSSWELVAWQTALGVLLEDMRLLSATTRRQTAERARRGSILQLKATMNLRTVLIA